MNYRLSFVSTLLLLFTACGGGSSTSQSDVAMSCEESVTPNLFQKQTQRQMIVNNPNNSANILVQNIQVDTDTDVNSQTEPLFSQEYLYNLFKTEYFWANQITDGIDYASYNTPQSLINDLKNTQDRWSFSMTKEKYGNITSQKSTGFGFACVDVSYGCHVTYVRIDSPADKMGLKRGDIVTKINEKSASKVRIAEMGKEEKGLVNFNVQRNNSNELCTCKITPRDYTYKVAMAKVVNSDKGEKVGYFRLDSFLGGEEIIKQMDESFDFFKKEEVNKLIIDLRYNGGGAVSVASKLIDKLSIDKKGLVQFTLAWNDDYEKNNETYRFQETNNALNLEKILFLTTNNSASASELVISAMKPHLGNENVIIIGKKTHGKPVGMGGRSDGDYYYFLINFVVKNAVNFYDYFNGFPVTKGCDIKDDTFHEMGDKEELMLKAALQYVDTGRCQ